MYLSPKGDLKLIYVYGSKSELKQLVWLQKMMEE